MDTDNLKEDSAVFEPRPREIEQQSDLQATGFQVVQNLAHVCWSQVLDSFELNDDHLLDDDVSEVSPDL